MRPLPALPIDSLRGRTGDEVIELLGRPDERERGEVWWSAEERSAVRLAGDRLEPAEVFGPLPSRIPPEVVYETWRFSFGETLEEAARAIPGPAPPSPQGETWWLYLASADGAPRVVEVASFPAGIDF